MKYQQLLWTIIGIIIFNPAGFCFELPLEKGTVLSLQETMDLALTYNYELAASEWEIKAKSAAAFQAGRMLNPELEIEVEEFGNEGFDNAVATLRMNQTIELGGKRRYRSAIADCESDIAQRKNETTRLDIICQTKNRFVELLEAQKLLELAESIHQVVEITNNTVAERVAAGKDSPIEQIKSQTELAGVDLTLEQARGTLIMKKNALSALWGNSINDFERVSGDLDKIYAEIIIQKIPSDNPRLARLESEVKRSKLILESEKSQRIPDLGVSLGISLNNNDSTEIYTAGINFGIPSFNRKKGAVQEANAELQRAKYGRDFIRTGLNSELGDVLQIIKISRSTALALKNKILPGAQKAFDAAGEGYQMGRFSYLEVLDAQRVLFDVETKLIEAQAEYHKAIADLEYLTGKKMEDSQ